MKRNLLQLFCMTFVLALTNNVNAQRYVSATFTSYTKTTLFYDTNRAVNLLYGQITGLQPIVDFPLNCDIYQPAGDTAMARPVIILASTGSFLPPVLNRQPTGSKNDSSIVEMCMRFALKGYVAVAMNYRSGWNPGASATDAPVQLIQAAYRGIQDMRACVRFMRVNASVYKIDTSKIIVGGQGTGGYIALGVATVNSKSKITEPKFQRGDFTPMVSVDTLGDWMGLGGNPFFHKGGDPAVAANVHMAFNYGGAMGDSLWLDAASIPIVSMQCPTDPFAPFHTGNVVVPTTGITVIPTASGAGDIIPRANRVGVNAKLNAKTYTDVYSTHAMAVSGGVNNVYPFISSFPAESAPWEWWDRATVQAIVNISYLGIPIPASGHVADSLALLTNPTMSAAKAKAYIDTIQGFLCPRIAAQFNLVAGSGINEVENASDYLSVYPNPSKTNVTVKMDKTKISISDISVLDITGKVMQSENNLNTFEHSINVSSLNPGMYFIQVKFANGSTVAKRLMVQ